MITTGFNFLIALTGVHLIDLFFIAIVFDIPRYLLGFVAVAASMALFPAKRDDAGQGMRAAGNDASSNELVSILIAGHNEEATIERCVRSLREQSYSGPLEIICVDDGSVDNTFSIMSRLARSGLIQRAVRLDLRGGKSAALNLAAKLASGEILLTVDCDCSFDRHALRELLQVLREDPGAAAVCGNILVRNWRTNLLTRLQAIEYMITISLGKSLADAIGQVVCISGAFGAFRRQAWEAVGGHDVGPGEDADITFRLRIAGYRVRFANNAICYTGVPVTLNALARQRGRWERDIFWIRFRKYGFLFDPSHQSFRVSELVNQLDFFIFTLLPTILFPVYFLYLVIMMPGFAVMLITAVVIALAFLDVFAFLLALSLLGRSEYVSLLLLAPLYGLGQAYGMRLLRLSAYLDEMIFSRSIDDNFVPAKVRAWSIWR